MEQPTRRFIRMTAFVRSSWVSTRVTSLRVTEGDVERAKVVLEGIVVSGIGLDEAAELPVPEGLLDAGIAPESGFVAEARLVLHSAKGARVLEP